MMLECDYLVIGAGASGMAFTDELIHSTKDTTVIILDKRAKPGGHWNDAYDFVTLHQPAAFYGVNSKQLGRGGNELATFCELRAYYELVMKELVSTGRVTFFPQCESKGNNIFQSMLQPGLEYKVKVNKKTVDATYIEPGIPSLHKPDFGVSPGVNLIPINGLSHTKSPWERYVVIGGGKTGIDAVLFLLSNLVEADHITWIIPNDYWLLNRKFVFTDNFANYSIKMMNCIVGCDSHEELFKRFEAVGWFMRLDTSVEPRSLKGGTVVQEELDLLRRVKHIIRRGRIASIESNRIIFQDESEIEISKNTLNVDCSANGSAPFIPKKIFDGNVITLQDIRQLQAVFSAAVVAAFECRFPDDENRKNSVLTPIFHPQTATDYVIGMKQNLCNENAVASELGMRWLRNSRLNHVHHISTYSFLRYLLYIKKFGMSIYEALDKMVTKIEGL